MPKFVFVLQLQEQFFHHQAFILRFAPLWLRAQGIKQRSDQLLQLPDLSLRGAQQLLSSLRILIGTKIQQGFVGSLRHSYRRLEFVREIAHKLRGGSRFLLSQTQQCQHPNRNDEEKQENHKTRDFVAQHHLPARLIAQHIGLRIVIAHKERVRQIVPSGLKFISTPRHPLLGVKGAKCHFIIDQIHFP